MGGKSDGYRSSDPEDDVSVEVSDSLDFDRFLECDEVDSDILNCSSFSERWPESPVLSESPMTSDRPLVSGNWFARSCLTEGLSQRHMDGEIDCSVLDAHCGSSTIATLEKGVGLENLGNTCFLNSVLQCFLHTVPLLHGILLDTHVVVSKCSEESFCVLCALQQLVVLSLTRTNATIKPLMIVNNLSYFSSSFRGFEQEDAHEFLQCFLDRLERCCDLNQQDCKYSDGGNLVTDVFGGYLVSKLKCFNCDHCSDTYEPSVDLSLEVEDADNLLTALESFTKVEKIEDIENMFICENCNEKVSIAKQLAFYQAPSVAAFHLKRFKNDGCFVEKIDKHVAFPLELDLLPFTCGGEEICGELKYNLYAVIVHVGSSATSGHYFCIIRLSPNVWCKFDDSRVVQVDEKFVLSQEAYILFYAKESTSWFSTFVETQKQPMKSKILKTSPKSVLDPLSPVALSPPHKYFICDATESKYIEAEYHGDKENDLSCKISTNDCFDSYSHESKREGFSYSIEKVSLQRSVGTLGKIQFFNPLTPPRSLSSEIGRDDSPDSVVPIQRNHHTWSANPVSCKRQLDKDLDDPETTQACSLIQKSMTGASGNQLLAAKMGSKTDISVGNKKRRRPDSPSILDDSNTSCCHSSSIRPVSHPLLAGGFRKFEMRELQD